MKNNFDKKPGSLEEVVSGITTKEQGEYQKLFKKELEKAGKGIGAMTPKEKQGFFNKIDKMYKGKNEEVELEEKYDLYHKDFSSAMQHAYDYAKKKMGITVDPKEIDSKVATGPKKPTEGKTNKYRLKGKGGNLQIQVYNKGGSKPFELNMYKEETIVEFTSQQIKQAYGIANDPRYKQGNYSGAVKTINKIAPGLADHPDVRKVLKRTNEKLDETHVNQTKDANQRQKDAKGEKEIIKSVAETIKDMWKEAAEDKKKKDVAPETDNIDEKDKLKAELEKKDDEIQALKVKAETEKAKTAKKETEKMTNPETGEPLLQVGVAYKHLRDKMKEETLKKESEKELKNKDRTDTGKKADEIDTKPQIKYEK